MLRWLNIQGKILHWLNTRKSQKETEIVARGLLELHFLAITFHGRYQLSHVITAAEQDEIYIDPVILSMYRWFMVNAPYQTYALYN